MTPTDDAFTTNDTGTGPTATNDRNDHVAIRNHAATRKRIGFFKYDISEVDPLLFPVATLTGTFEGSFDGDGVFSVYGLNDGVTNMDNVPDGSFGEANWTEGALTYAMGLGVDVSVAPETVGDLGLDLAEVSLLGTIALADGMPIASNTIDLPLEPFLSADTNGVVTFVIADENPATDMEGAPAGIEWRITAREASEAGSLRLSFSPLPGDTNLDNMVDLTDLTPIRMNYLAQDVAYTDGDLNGDNVVGFGDFRIWKTGFLAGGGSLADADLGFLAVPEPTAAGLLMVAAAGLGIGLRTRRPCRFDA